MKRIVVALFLLLFAANTNAIDARRRYYKLALHLTNPLGAMSKGGAILESRLGSITQLVGYTQYWGAFEGKQTFYEFHKYFKSEKPHQYYMYVRGLAGEMTFNNEKLKLLGHTQEIVIGPKAYIGGAIGAGKRYNYNVLFFRWHLGLKACLVSLDKADDDYEKAMNSMFRLFYFTGPGSIIDAGIHFGIQI